MYTKCVITFVKDGKLWYIIDGAWMNAWLEFVVIGKNISPAPGPINNLSLLTPDYEAKQFKARRGLVLVKRNSNGHYRRITKEMWQYFQEFYDGSGPEIKVYFREVSIISCICDKNNRSKFARILLTK